MSYIKKSYLRGFFINTAEKTRLSNLTTISTEALISKLEDSNNQLIDVRPIEAYNGWKLKNEPRGGHIKNARCLPFKWLHYIDWIEIVRAKKIMPHHSIIVYGYDISRTEKVAHHFIKARYNDVQVYHNFTKEWSVNKLLPMERLKR